LKLPQTNLQLHLKMVQFGSTDFYGSIHLLKFFSSRSLQNFNYLYGNILKVFKKNPVLEERIKRSSTLESRKKYQNERLFIDSIEVIPIYNLFSTTFSFPKTHSLDFIIEILVKCSGGLDECCNLFIRRIFEEVNEFNALDECILSNSLVIVNHLREKQNLSIPFQHKPSQPGDQERDEDDDDAALPSPPKQQKLKRQQILSILKSAIMNEYEIYLEMFILLEDRVMPSFSPANPSGGGANPNGAGRGAQDFHQRHFQRQTFDVYREPSTGLVRVRRKYKLTYIDANNVIKCFTKFPIESILTGIFHNSYESSLAVSLYTQAINSVTRSHGPPSSGTNGDQKSNEVALKASLLLNDFITSLCYQVTELYNGGEFYRMNERMLLLQSIFEKKISLNDLRDQAATEQQRKADGQQPGGAGGALVVSTSKLLEELSEIPTHLPRQVHAIRDAIQSLLAALLLLSDYLHVLLLSLGTDAAGGGGTGGGGQGQDGGSGGGGGFVFQPENFSLRYEKLFFLSQRLPALLDELKQLLHEFFLTATNSVVAGVQELVLKKYFLSLIYARRHRVVLPPPDQLLDARGRPRRPLPRLVAGQLQSYLFHLAHLEKYLGKLDLLLKALETNFAVEILFELFSRDFESYQLSFQSASADGNGNGDGSASREDAGPTSTSAMIIQAAGEAAGGRGRGRSRGGEAGDQENDLLNQRSNLASYYEHRYLLSDLPRCLLDLVGFVFSRVQIHYQKTNPDLRDHPNPSSNPNPSQRGNGPRRFQHRMSASSAMAAHHRHRDDTEAEETEDLDWLEAGDAENYWRPLQLMDYYYQPAPRDKARGKSKGKKTAEGVGNEELARDLLVQRSVVQNENYVHSVLNPQLFDFYHHLGQLSAARLPGLVDCQRLLGRELSEQTRGDFHSAILAEAARLRYLKDTRLLGLLHGLSFELLAVPKRWPRFLLANWLVASQLLRHSAASLPLLPSPVPAPPAAQTKGSSQGKSEEGGLGLGLGLGEVREEYLFASLRLGRLHSLSRPRGRSSASSSSGEAEAPAFLTEDGPYRLSFPAQSAAAEKADTLFSGGLLGNDRLLAVLGLHAHATVFAAAWSFPALLPSPPPAAIGFSVKLLCGMSALTALKLAYGGEGRRLYRRSLDKAARRAARQQDGRDSPGRPDPSETVEEEDGPADGLSHEERALRLARRLQREAGDSSRPAHPAATSGRGGWFSGGRKGREGPAIVIDHDGLYDEAAHGLAEQKEAAAEDSAASEEEPEQRPSEAEAEESSGGEGKKKKNGRSSRRSRRTGRAGAEEVDVDEGNLGLPAEEVLELVYLAELQQPAFLDKVRRSFGREAVRLLQFLAASPSLLLAKIVFPPTAAAAANGRGLGMRAEEDEDDHPEAVCFSLAELLADPSLFEAVERNAAKSGRCIIRGGRLTLPAAHGQRLSLEKLLGLFQKAVERGGAEGEAGGFDEVFEFEPLPANPSRNPNPSAPSQKQPQPPRAASTSAKETGRSFAAIREEEQEEAEADEDRGQSFRFDPTYSDSSRLYRNSHFQAVLAAHLAAVPSEEFVYAPFSLTLTLLAVRAAPRHQQAAQRRQQQRLGRQHQPGRLSADTPASASSRGPRDSAGPTGFGAAGEEFLDRQLVLVGREEEVARLLVSTVWFSRETAELLWGHFVYPPASPGPAPGLAASSSSSAQRPPVSFWNFLAAEVAALERLQRFYFFQAPSGRLFLEYAALQAVLLQDFGLTPTAAVSAEEPLSEEVADFEALLFGLQGHLGHKFAAVAATLKLAAAQFVEGAGHGPGGGQQGEGAALAGEGAVGNELSLPALERTLLTHGDLAVKYLAASPSCLYGHGLLARGLSLLEAFCYNNRLLPVPLPLARRIQDFSLRTDPLAAAPGPSPAAKKRGRRGLFSSSSASSPRGRKKRDREAALGREQVRAVYWREKQLAVYQSAFLPLNGLLLPYSRKTASFADSFALAENVGLSRELLAELLAALELLGELFTKDLLLLLGPFAHRSLGPALATPSPTSAPDQPVAEGGRRWKRFALLEENFGRFFPAASLGRPPLEKAVWGREEAAAQAVGLFFHSSAYQLLLRTPFAARPADLLEEVQQEAARQRLRRQFAEQRARFFGPEEAAEEQREKDKAAAAGERKTSLLGLLRQATAAASSPQPQPPMPSPRARKPTAPVRPSERPLWLFYREWREWLRRYRLLEDGRQRKEQAATHSLFLRNVQKISRLRAAMKLLQTSGGAGGQSHPAAPLLDGLSRKDGRVAFLFSPQQTEEAAAQLQAAEEGPIDGELAGRVRRERERESFLADSLYAKVLSSADRLAFLTTFHDDQRPPAPAPDTNAPAPTALAPGPGAEPMEAERNSFPSLSASGFQLVGRSLDELLAQRHGGEDGAGPRRAVSVLQLLRVYGRVRDGQNELGQPVHPNPL
jgi:hypothetical protein